jgi:hypothetical protein
MENGKTNPEREERLRLVAERRGGLLCVTVCEDGLRCGGDWPHCVNPLRCIDEGGCFWRYFHGIPTDKMRKKCDASLD